MNSSVIGGIPQLPSLPTAHSSNNKTGFKSVFKGTRIAVGLISLPFTTVIGATCGAIFGALASVPMGISAGYLRYKNSGLSSGLLVLGKANVIIPPLSTYLFAQRGAALSRKLAGVYSFRDFFRERRTENTLF